MEIKIETEKTVEQIIGKMVQILSKIASRYVTLGMRALMTNNDMGAEDILWDADIQKELLSYNKLIGLVESVKPLDERSEKHKAVLLKAVNGETASNLFERLMDLVEKAQTATGVLSVCHTYVPLIVHRMRAEGIIKEGGEDE